MTELHPGVARFLLRSHHGNEILIFPCTALAKDNLIFKLSQSMMVLYTQPEPLQQERISRDLRKTRHSYLGHEYTRI